MTRLCSIALVAAFVTLASDFPIHAQPKKDPLKYVTNSIGMKFVWIPPGNFVMGSPKEEKGRGSDEIQHKVTLTKGFYMGVYTVTQEQWKEVMGNNPSRFVEKNLPVDSVSWFGCQEFIKKLREKDKRLYRLPTEAEWEYACRAGTTTPFHFGEKISVEIANVGRYRDRTTPVGSFPANAWGLYDMHANVQQWCQDWYGDYPQEDVADPQGPNKGKERVLRGGSWANRGDGCRSACRYDGLLPGVLRADYCGFRLCFFEEPTIKVPDANDSQPKNDPPKNFTNSLGMKFMWIPAGSFVMGSPKEEEGRGERETEHKVKLSKGFYMGVHLVTQEQWEALMGNNPSKFKGEKNLPVEEVSWDDCQQFIKKLREKDKKLYRLPSESEWEYSCRAGTKTPFHFGETITTDQANYNGDFTYGEGKKGKFREKTTQVGSFPANAWGLHDMHGNVFQWCEDWYADYPQKDVIDPQGPEKGQSRVLRGGSWLDYPGCCRSAFRSWVDPGYRHGSVGFRLCFCLD